MSAQLLDGKLVAQQVRTQVATQIERLDFSPGLATVLVGEDPASQVYIRNKRRTAEQLGIVSVHHHLPETVTQLELTQLVQQLNRDQTIHAILIQLPLPTGLDSEAIVNQIDPQKDADGLHPQNLGRLVQDRPGLRPCTPAGVMQILQHYQLPTQGKRVVVVGRSFLVGRPLALMFSARGVDATVTLAHSRTQQLAQLTSQADILVAAVGVPAIIGTDHVSPGAVVIDVGINRTSTGLVGDVDPDAADRAGWLTPVPGGVGPMTVAMLMHNTVTAAQAQTRSDQATK